MKAICRALTAGSVRSRVSWMSGPAAKAEKAARGRSADKTGTRNFMERPSEPILEDAGERYQRRRGRSQWLSAAAFASRTGGREILARREPPIVTCLLLWSRRSSFFGDGRRVCSRSDAES